MNDIDGRPALFSLEDDQYLQQDVREFAEEEGWIVYSSRCVDDAITIFSQHSKEIRLAIIDMMVPVKHEQLEQLELLEKERVGYIEGKFSDITQVTSMNQEQLSQTRSDLVEIDKSIRRVVDFDGGRQFLQFLAADSSRCPVVVFSARIDPAKDDEHIQKLREQGRWKGWRPKPIDPSILADLLLASKGGAT